MKALLRSTTRISSTDRGTTQFTPNELKEACSTPDFLAMCVDHFRVAFPESDWDDAMFRHIFFDDERIAVIFISKNDLRINGFTAIQTRKENGERSANVHWIGVSEKRKGIGVMLVSLIWDWMAENGKDELFAYSTTYTPEVERFYHSLSFEELWVRE